MLRFYSLSRKVWRVYFASEWPLYGLILLNFSLQLPQLTDAKKLFLGKLSRHCNTLDIMSRAHWWERNSVESSGMTAERLASHFGVAWASLDSLLERRKPPCHHHGGLLFPQLSPYSVTIDQIDNWKLNQYNALNPLLLVFLVLDCNALRFSIVRNGNNFTTSLNR